MSNIPNVSQSLEVFYETNVNTLAGNSSVHYIFPPTDLYNNNGEVIEPYVSQQSDRIVNADIAFLKLNSFVDADQSDPTYKDGDWEGTNVSGAFYAVEADDYYYKYKGSGTLDKPDLKRFSPWIASTSYVIGDNVDYLGTIYKCKTNNIDELFTESKWTKGTHPKVAEAIKLPISSVGATFENKTLGMSTANVNRYDDLEVEGLNEGYKPNSMQSTVIRLDGQDIEDVTYRCFDATPITDPNTDIDDANIIKLQVDAQVGRTFAGIDAGFINEDSNEYVNEDAINWTVDKHVSAIEIVNIETDADDNRYGDAEDDLPYIFTGRSYYFTDAEIVKNLAGTPDAISGIDVYGGDCFVGLHTFKITDSAYSLTEQQKLIDGSGSQGGISAQTKKWGYLFKKHPLPSTSVEDVSRPFPLKGVSQTITVLMEAEVNPEVGEKTEHNEFDYDVSASESATNIPVPVVNDAGQIRSVFRYRFNLDYARANNYKVFFPYKTYEKNNNEFGARIPYSDQKIYNTDIEGFDRFRVLNFFDLDESHGSGMKLVEAADRIFALQESALSYIPINAQVIESADGGSLSVRNAEIIGIPNKIDVLYGTQHPKTVKVDGNMFLFTDKLRGEVLMFDGQKVQRISNNGMESWFNTEFSALSTHSDLSAIYDNKKKEYMVYFRGSDSAVFNAEDGTWSSRFPETSTINTLAGARVGEVFMLAGIDSTKNVKVGSLYTSGGTIGQWWGTTFTPSVTTIINPEPDITKVFDVFTINSDLEPTPSSFIVLSPTGTSSTADLSAAVVTSREGTFRIKNLRDAAGARSRGVYGKLKMTLTDTSQSGITSILTRYRASNKPI